MPDHSLTNELQQILDRFNAGDPAAKKHLIDRAYERLIVVARRVLNSFSAVRSEEETATVLNQAYLRLHSSLEEVRPRTVQLFYGLAALQVRRVLLDAIRELRGGRGASPRPRKQSLHTPQRGGDSEGDGHDPTDSDPGPTGIGLQTDVLEAIDKLPEEERQVVDLLFFHGLTQPEAAETLGMHEDTIKRRWARARIKLAGLLEGYDLCE
jgi:RNA polymerase sigma-70 factor (ECF subfamily)